jgi:hypothetical protein
VACAKDAAHLLFLTQPHPLCSAGRRVGPITERWLSAKLVRRNIRRFNHNACDQQAAADTKQEARQEKHSRPQKIALAAEVMGEILHTRILTLAATLLMFPTSASSQEIEVGRDGVKIEPDRHRHYQAGRAIAASAVSCVAPYLIGINLETSRSVGFHMPRRSA